MLPKWEWSQSGERVRYVQHVSILEYVSNFPHMTCHCASGSTPKRIKGAPDRDALKGVTGRVTAPESSPSDVEALTFRTLEGTAQVIAGASLSEAEFVLNLGQACPIEIPGYGSFEGIKGVGSKACRAPRSLAMLRCSTAVAIVPADDAQPEGDKFLTSLTGHFRTPPPPVSSP